MVCNSILLENTEHTNPPSREIPINPWILQRSPPRPKRELIHYFKCYECDDKIPAFCINNKSGNSQIEFTRFESDTFKSPSGNNVCQQCYEEKTRVGVVVVSDVYFLK